MATTYIFLAAFGFRTTSRMHYNMEIKLKQGGVPIHGEPVGEEQLMFAVEDAIGASFEGIVTVKSPLTPGPNGQPSDQPMVPFDILQISQRFTISRAAAPVPEGPLHPLVTISPSVGTPAAASVQLVFHTGSLDVTSFYLSLRRAAAQYDVFHDLDAKIETIDGKPWFKRDAFAGCNVRLIQGRSGGIYWVLIPPSIGSDTTRASFIDMVPERGTPYRDVFDVDLKDTARYILSNVDSGYYREPHHGVPQLEPDRFRGFVRPARRGEVHNPIRLSEFTAETFSVSLHNFPPLRLAEQLANSGRKAILRLTVPMAEIAPYSPTRPRRHARPVPPNLNYDWRAMDQGLLASLQAMGVVGTPTGDPVVLDKVVVAGHGASCAPTIQRFDANRDEIDELWLFDPDDILTYWPLLDHAGNARIRLIGGVMLTMITVLAKNIGVREGPEDVHTVPSTAGNFTVWPRNPNFYWKSKAYAKAYTLSRWNAERGRVEDIDGTLSRLEWPDVQEQERLGPSAPHRTFDSPISEALGLAEVGPDALGPPMLAHVLANDAWPTPAQSFSSKEEYAAFQRMITGERRASSELQLASVDTTLQRYFDVRLREWTLFGWQALSDGNDENEADYKSYFELCLHFSSIEQGTAVAATGPSVILPSLPEHIRSVPMRTRAGEGGSEQGG